MTPGMVEVDAGKPIASGNLEPTLPVVVIPVICANGGGTADGQMASSLLVLDTASTPPSTVAILGTSAEASSFPGGHVPIFDEARDSMELSIGSLRATQIWYGPDDGTCCGSGLAVTTWRYVDGTLANPKTLITVPPESLRPKVERHLPVLANVNASGTLVGVDTKRQTADIMIWCGVPANDIGEHLVGLRGANFQVDTNPAHPNLGKVQTVSFTRWVQYIRHNWWNGYVLAGSPKTVTNGPGPRQIYYGKAAPRSCRVAS